MVSLRHAGADDLDGVLRLWDEAQVEPTVTDDAESLRDLMASDPQALLVAVDDDRVVGSLIIGWDGWRGAFYRLAVAPDHRRTGLARRMVAQGEDQLRRTGARRLAVITVAGEPGANHFWEAVGYQVQADRQRRVKNFPVRASS